ncbi:MAG TPA: hypothetical protein VGH49_18245 [Xanthobacteraceae bacterium]
MTALSEFFGRKSITAAAEIFPPLSPAQGPNGDDRSATEGWAEIGSRIGGDNEVLRNLLVDTGRRIRAIEDLKNAFGKLVDPIQKTLRTLEQEKSDNVGLRGTLGEVRTSYEALRAEFNDLAKKSAAGDTEQERLRHELELSQQSVRALEANKLELAEGLAAMRPKLADLERQLAQETAAARLLNERHQSQAEHAAASDRRIVELESETALAREKFVLLENEKSSLHASLDQTVGENSRISRRLAESETALKAAKARVEQMNAALATADAERKKLTAAIDEANERRRAETNTLSMRLEGTQSRTNAAEKLLAEIRQNLVTRAEESRVAERKVLETNIARNLSDKKVEQLTNALREKDRHIQDATQTHAAVAERSDALLKTLKTREAALARAEEKLQTLADRIAFLEAEAEGNRVKAEKRIEELNSGMQRERLERAVAEGALEAMRKSYAELQHDAEAAGRIGAEPHENVDAGGADEPQDPKSGNRNTASAVDPKTANGGTPALPIVMP